MWREINLFGAYMSPLVVYGLVAFGITVLARWLMVRARLYRWVWNPSLAEAAFFVCVLALLVAFL